MNRKLVLIFLGALIFRLILAPLIWHPDLNNHVDWGIRFFQYGVDKLYSPESNVWSFTWPNQPPGTLLIFAGIYKLYLFLFSIVWWVNTHFAFFPSAIMPFFEHNFYQGLLKLPSIIADFGIAYLIFLFLKEKSEKIAIYGAILFLINPVIWYNSAVWGQTDAVINFLFLGGFWLLTKRKIFLSFIFIALCLFIKISLAIFLPVYLIYLIRQGNKLHRIALASFVALVLIVILTLPFSGSKEPISWLLTIYREKVLTNQLQVINANAFNFWAIFTGITLKPQSLMLGPLSYQTWGYVLFGISMLPVLIRLWKAPSEQNTIWSFILIAFSSWLLLTNMHERYLYPVFPFFTIVVAQNRKLLSFYIGLSVINFLNLYTLWWVPGISILKNFLSYGDFLAGRVFGLVNTVIFTLLYKQGLALRWHRKKNIIEPWGEGK